MGSLTAYLKEEGKIKNSGGGGIPRPPPFYVVRPAGRTHLELKVVSACLTGSQVRTDGDGTVSRTAKLVTVK